jgi:creatinine amidohydrolase
MTWEEVRDSVADGDDLILIPIGAVEQHGPGLTLGTDWYAAHEVAVAAAEELDSFLAPTLPYGSSVNHMEYPGTVTLQQDTFIKVVTDLISSLAQHGFSRIFVVNGHGGNTYPSLVAAREAKLLHPNCLIGVNLMWDAMTTSEEFKSVWKSYAPEMKERNFMGHGGIVEAAVNLVYAEDTIRYEKLQEEGALADAEPVIRNEASSVQILTNIQEFAPTGGFGKFAEFDKHLGEELIRSAGKKLATDIRDAIEIFGRS